MRHVYFLQYFVSIRCARALRSMGYAPRMLARISSLATNATMHLKQIIKEVPTRSSDTNLLPMIYTHFNPPLKPQYGRFWKSRAYKEDTAESGI